MSICVLSPNFGEHNVTRTWAIGFSLPPGRKPSSEFLDLEILRDVWIVDPVGTGMVYFQLPPGRSSCCGRQGKATRSHHPPCFGRSTRPDCFNGRVVHSGDSNLVGLFFADMLLSFLFVFAVTVFK